jgi:hypothetical protein
LKLNYSCSQARSSLSVYLTYSLNTFIPLKIDGYQLKQGELMFFWFLKRIQNMVNKVVLSGAFFKGFKLTTRVYRFADLRETLWIIQCCAKSKIKYGGRMKAGDELEVWLESERWLGVGKGETGRIFHQDSIHLFSLLYLPDTFLSLSTSYLSVPSIKTH